MPGCRSARAAEDQRVDIVGALVGVHHFQVDQVAGDAEFVGDAVAAQHVAGQAGDVEGLAAAVALHDRGDFHRRGAFVLHPPQAQAALQGQGDLGLHVGQLLLDQLVGGQRAAELLAVEHVLAGGVPAEFGGAQGAPGDPVARRVQAGERTAQAAHFGEGVLFRNEHVVHHDLAGDRGTQADLAMDRRGAQAFPALLEDEAADLPFVILGPDHEDVGDRAVGDPHLAAAQAIAAVDLLRPGDHRARVGTVVRLGQAEAADVFAAGQLGQVLLPGGFVAEFMDRHHHQRGLHAHHRAIAGVDALDFASDQAIADVVEAAAAVGFGNGRAEQAGLAHLAEDLRVGLFVAEGFEHARGQLVLGELLGAVANHALFFGELLVQQQGIFPVEASFGGHAYILVKR